MLRFNAYGFRRESMREWLATAKPLANGASPEVVAIVARARREGLPFQGLDREQSGHFDAAKAMATSSQPLVSLDTDWYSALSFSALRDKCPELREPGFEILASGRPWFGQRFNPLLGIYYGVVGAAELLRIGEGARRVLDRSPPVTPSAEAVIAANSASKQLAAELRQALPASGDAAALVAFLDRVVALRDRLGARDASSLAMSAVARVEGCLNAKSPALSMYYKKERAWAARQPVSAGERLLIADLVKWTDALSEAGLDMIFFAQ